MKKNHIIIGITGGIAAYKACDLIRLFKKNAHEVTCVITKEAREFVTQLTLETLSNNKIIDDMFSLPENRSPLHISLADKADLIVVCPATANIIGKLASGICDDILTCIMCSSKAPVLIAPAMNDLMYKNKIVQKNIASLKETGYKFIGPVKGPLASGYEAIGHLADVNSIFQMSKNLLK